MTFTRRAFLQTSAIAGLGFVSPLPSWAVNTAGVKPAPFMPVPSFVETNGLTMAVYEKGTGVPGHLKKELEVAKP